MFNQVSMTGTGVAVFVLTQIFDYYSLVVTPEQITSGVNGIVAFVSFCMIVYGQLRRKDLVGGILRK